MGFPTLVTLGRDFLSGYYSLSGTLNMLLYEDSESIDMG